MPKQDERIKQDDDDRKMGRYLKRKGFDKSWWSFESGHWRVSCSQCAASTVNGVAIHEQGCPNEK